MNGLFSVARLDGSEKRAHPNHTPQGKHRRSRKGGLVKVVDTRRLPLCVFSARVDESRWATGGAALLVGAVVLLFISIGSTARVDENLVAGHRSDPQKEEPPSWGQRDLVPVLCQVGRHRYRCHLHNRRTAPPFLQSVGNEC